MIVTGQGDTKSISIHAPSRERPRGGIIPIFYADFNPRSLAGATVKVTGLLFYISISIHAPSRERRNPVWYSIYKQNISIHAPSRERPRLMIGLYVVFIFQSTLPRGSDSIKTNYFSINLSQAFFANRLNSNTQEFYFDVRKLIVSHSSSSCEPKLNFMFHITSHRINLDYFSSCQSICK